MSEEKEKGCSKLECTIKWLKTVDEWSVGGWKNTFPRLYYTVAGLIVLFLLV